MGIVKVSTDFSYKNYTDTELGVQATNVTDKMLGNVNFPAPMPPLIEIKETITGYTASLVKAEKGSADDRVIKNSWRAKLESQMKELSLYVQIASKGDSVLISSTGLDVNKKPVAVGALPKPENVIIKMGDNKGTVWVSCEAIPSASFYEFEYAEVTADGTLSWIHKTSTKHKVLIEGLTSGKQYVFRIAGAASDPSRVWSDQISTFVI
jgi:hypothetical protein